MASARRVLLLSRGGALDGEQRQLCHLATRLDRACFEPLVLLDEEGPCAAELRRGGVQLAVLPTRDWRRFPEILFRYIDAASVLRQARAWSVHLVHASNRWKSHYGRYVARHMGIPCVMHARGPMSPRDMAKHGFTRAAAILAISRRYQEDLVQAGLPAQRVHLVDDAVDDASFYPDPAGRQTVRREWGLGDQVALGIVGRIEPFKQTLELLGAVAKLPPEQPAACLVIGQPGPADYMQRIHAAMTRPELQRRVQFTGQRADMRQVLSALDLLVTLSGGSVMFEAMACGTPVLTIRTDQRFSVHTRHNDTAWCLTTTDPAQIARTIEQLLADAPLRRRLGDAGRQWTTSHLSVTALVTKTEAVYKHVLGESTGHAKQIS